MRECKRSSYNEHLVPPPPQTLAVALLYLNDKVISLIDSIDFIKNFIQLQNVLFLQLSFKVLSYYFK